jgi:uncharacterized protein YpmS
MSFLGMFRILMRLLLCLLVVDSKASVTQASGSATDMEYQLECNPSLTIRAALSLTAQLVSLIASYLDVNLPRRVSYRFCISQQFLSI